MIHHIKKGKFFRKACVFYVDPDSLDPDPEFQVNPDTDPVPVSDPVPVADPRFSIMTKNLQKIYS
jgi:hypothetical protein